jgi:hypothetical protein
MSGMAPLPTCPTSAPESTRELGVSGERPRRRTSLFMERKTWPARRLESAGDRGEKPRGIEEGSRPSGRLAGETACPTACIRFFIKFRGRNAHPNRVEKPPPNAGTRLQRHGRADCQSATGWQPAPQKSACKLSAPRGFLSNFAGRRPIQTGREAYRTLGFRRVMSHE